MKKVGFEPRTSRSRGERVDHTNRYYCNFWLGHDDGIIVAKLAWNTEVVGSSIPTKHFSVESAGLKLTHSEKELRKRHLKLCRPDWPNKRNPRL